MNASQDPQAKPGETSAPAGSANVRPDPVEPDTDVQAGSGKVDFTSGRPSDASGGDAPSHDST